jgi:hypothetical protein
MKLKQKTIVILIILIICTISIGCTITKNNQTKQANQSNTNSIDLKQSKEEIDPKPTVEVISYDDYIESLRDSMKSRLEKAIEYDDKVTEDYFKKLYDTKSISKEHTKIYEVRATKTCSFNDNLKIKVGGVFKICDLKGKKEIIHVVPFTENTTNIKKLKWRESVSEAEYGYPPNKVTLCVRGQFINELIETKKRGIKLGIFSFYAYRNTPLYNVSKPFTVSVPFDSSNM